MTTRKRRPVSGQERQGGVTVVRGADRLVMAAVLMTSATVTATIMTSITLVAAGTAVIMAATALVTTTAVTAGAAIFMAITTLIAAAIAVGTAILLVSTALVTAAVTIGAGAAPVTVLGKFTVIAVAGAVMVTVPGRIAVVAVAGGVTVPVPGGVTVVAVAGAVTVMVFNGTAVTAGAVALMIWDNSMDSLRETFVVVITRAANVMVMVPDRVAFAARAVVVLNIVCQSPHLIRLLLSKLHLQFGLGGLIGNHVLNGHPDRIQRRTRLDRSEG
jgi:hypothetical protein